MRPAPGPPPRPPLLLPLILAGTCLVAAVTVLRQPGGPAGAPAGALRLVRVAYGVAAVLALVLAGATLWRRRVYAAYHEAARHVPPVPTSLVVACYPFARSAVQRRSVLEAKQEAIARVTADPATAAAAVAPVLDGAGRPAPAVGAAWMRALCLAVCVEGQDDLLGGLVEVGDRPVGGRLPRVPRPAVFRAAAELPLDMLDATGQLRRGFDRDGLVARARLLERAPHPA